MTDTMLLDELLPRFDATRIEHRERFWGGETSWEEIDAAEFTGFDRPGFARIACNLSLRPYGATRTLVSYEARTQATDDDARRAFLRYWTAVTAGVGVVMRSQLHAIERAARRG